MEFKFKFEQDEPQRALDIYLDIKVIYVAQDSALKSLGGGCGTLLMFNETALGLGFDAESRRVCGVGDYLGDIKKIQKGIIVKPKKFSSGILYVVSDEVFNEGCGYRCDIDKTILFDERNNNLQIGIFDQQKLCYRFLKNAYCQIENCELQGIIITDIM
jgi:hypothetical protein